MFGSIQRNVVRDELAVFGEQALKNAQAGHAESQNNIGLYYQMISGNTESYKQQVYLFQAAHWFTKAANQNYPPAQYNLALCYVTGEGVPRNYTEAASWYSKAAHLGYAPAQNNLGLLYEGGLGVTRSLEQAIYWWQLAANKGYEPAVYCLGPYWSQIRKFQEMKKARSEPSFHTNGNRKRSTDEASDEELETIAQEQEAQEETSKEQEDAKEALRQLKLQFKHKGGAQKLRELCHQFGMKYTDKDKTLIMLAQNQEIRTLLAQQRIITL